MTSQPVRAFQFVDVIVLGVLAVVLATLLTSHHKRHGPMLATLSQTIAHTKSSSLIFSITMTICFPLYYAFLGLWVSPRTAMPTIFYILLIISAVCELIFVWVPAKGTKAVVHTMAAGVVGVFMFIAALMIALVGKNVGSLAQAGLIVFLVVSVVMLAAIVKMPKRSFVFEIIYLVSFLLAISLVAHTS